MIRAISHADMDAWLGLRKQLWPHCSDAEHVDEMRSFLSEPERFAQFVSLDDLDQANGFAEASIRSDYVNGTESAPVAFLEGIFVAPNARRRGIARNLVLAVGDWARRRGMVELASDADIANAVSHATHRALGFQETERVVYFRKVLRNPS
jgi:aminoglycoside 6'-N-acetyltransferase I